MSPYLLTLAAIITATICGLAYLRATRPKVPAPRHRRQYDGNRPISPGYAPSTRNDPAPDHIRQLTTAGLQFAARRWGR